MYRSSKQIVAPVVTGNEARAHINRRLKLPYFAYFQSRRACLKVKSDISLSFGSFYSLSSEKNRLKRSRLCRIVTNVTSMRVDLVIFPATRHQCALNSLNVLKRYSSKLNSTLCTCSIPIIMHTPNMWIRDRFVVCSTQMLGQWIAFYEILSLKMRKS